MTNISYYHTGTNADLIQKVAALGYIKTTDHILDVTYGSGAWWRHFAGADLTRNGPINPHDFRELPYAWYAAFDVVAYDPPYRLNGRPDAFDEPYGTDTRTSVEDRIRLVYQGFFQSAYCVKSRGYLLVKVQDQVVSGRVHWLTLGCCEAATVLTEQGYPLALVDRFDMPPARPQPSGRRQVHARRGSTLLIFQRGSQ